MAGPSMAKNLADPVLVLGGSGFIGGQMGPKKMRRRLMSFFQDLKVSEALRWLQKASSTVSNGN